MLIGPLVQIKGEGGVTPPRAAPESAALQAQLAAVTAKFARLTAENEALVATHAAGGTGLVAKFDRLTAENEARRGATHAAGGTGLVAAGNQKLPEASVPCDVGLDGRHELPRTASASSREILHFPLDIETQAALDESALSGGDSAFSHEDAENAAPPEAPAPRRRSAAALSLIHI